VPDEHDADSSVENLTPIEGHPQIRKNRKRQPQAQENSLGA